MSSFEKFSYSLVILERHLDSFGHVNNTKYLEIFEEARWNFISEYGWGMEKIQKDQLGPVILEAQVKFKKELVLREKVHVISQTQEIFHKIMVLNQSLYNEHDQLCCEAIFKVGLMDLKKRQLVEPSADWLRAIGVHSL